MPGSVITPTCELLKNVARAGEPSKVQALPRPAGFIFDFMKSRIQAMPSV